MLKRGSALLVFQYKTHLPRFYPAGMVYLPRLSFSQENRIKQMPLQIFMDSPTVFPTKNGYRARKEIFRVKEELKLFDFCDDVNRLKRLAFVQSLITLGVHFTCPPLFGGIMMGTLGVVLYYTIKLHRMNTSILTLSAKLIEKVDISDDKKTLILTRMLRNSEPIICKISDIQYLRCFDRQDSEIDEGPVTDSSIGVMLKTEANNDQEKPMGPIFLFKIYYESDGTVIPNMGLLKAVLKGDVEEAKKYEIVTGSEIDLGNDIVNYLPENKVKEKKPDGV